MSRRGRGTDEQGTTGHVNREDKEIREFISGDVAKRRWTGRPRPWRGNSRDSSARGQNEKKRERRTRQEGALSYRGPLVPPLFGMPPFINPIDPPDNAAINRLKFHSPDTRISPGTSVSLFLFSRYLFFPPVSLPFPPSSRARAHFHVRVTGLFSSPSHMRPTENPLRPRRLSLFPLPSSSVSFCPPPPPPHSSPALPPFLPPPPSTPDLFLLQPCHAFGVFGKHEGSRGTFWDQCRRGCPTSWYTIHSPFIVVAAVRVDGPASCIRFLNFPILSISAEICAR